MVDPTLKRIFQLDTVADPAASISDARIELEMKIGPNGTFKNVQLTYEQLRALLAGAAGAPTAQQIFDLIQVGLGLEMTLQEGIIHLNTRQLEQPVPARPAAPTEVEVNDVSKEWVVRVNPAYPAYTQYKIGGLPGTSGNVSLGAGNAYQVNDVVHIKVGSAAPKGNLVLYVAGSGSVPDGKPLVNSAGFTGAAVTPTPDLTAALALSLAQITLGASVGYSITPGGGTAPYSYAVTATDVSTGQTYDLGTTKSGTWQPPAVDQYQVDAVVTDSSNPAKVVQTATRYLNVVAAANRIPVADAGQDVTIQLPTSSVALMGTASDPDPSDTVTPAWRQITGPGTATGLPATTLNVVASGLVAGTYQFGFRSTDNHGAQSTEDYVVVTVQAGSTTPKPVNYIPAGTSITYGAQVGGPGSGKTYPELTVAALNQAAGSARVSIAENMGIPTRSAHYFLTDTTTYGGQTPVQHAIGLVRAGYINVATLEFDANGLVYGDSGTDPSQAFTPAQVLGHVEQVYSQLKAGGYDLVGVSFTMNRTGYADFASFNATRLAYNRLQFASTVFQDGRINLPAYPNLYGFNAPTNTTFFQDGSHLETGGHVEMAKPNAQWFARHIAGFESLSIGLGAEPTTAEDSTGITAPPQESGTEGFAIYQDLPATLAVDPNNGKRLYSKATDGNFTAPAFLRQVIGVAEAGADVAFHVPISIKAGGQSQIVNLFAGADITRYQDALCSAFWNGTNYGFAEKGIFVVPQKAIPTGDNNVLHIIGYKGKIFYFLNQTQVGGGSLSIPNAPLGIACMLGGVPVGTAPEILNLQVFAASLGVRGTPAPTITTYRGNDPAFVRYQGTWGVNTEGAGESFTNDPNAIGYLRFVGYKVELYGNMDANIRMNTSLDAANVIFTDGRNFTPAADSLMVTYDGLGAGQHQFNVAKATNDNFYISVTRIVVYS